MVNNILTAAGIAHRRGRFTANPRPSTYAVYMDDVTSSGGDDAGYPRILQHDVTVELYEAAPDDAAETALEDVITAAGLEWSKQDRYWLQSEQLYQVVYELTYFEKRRA